jgi:Flp pilus assembly protein CpaB
MVARTLLQDVEVLATEKAFEAGADPVRPVGKVTLLVTPQDAEKLAVASDATRKSLLRLVARNLGDHERVGTDGELLADLLTDQRESFRVDIHRGGQKTPRIFHR